MLIYYGVKLFTRWAVRKGEEKSWWKTEEGKVMNYDLEN